MDIKTDLSSLVHQTVDKLKGNICSLCNAPQPLIKHLIPCEHVVCSSCLARSKKCPVCKNLYENKYPLDEHMLNALFLHTNYLKTINDNVTNSCENLEIKCYFVPYCDTSKQDHKGETRLHKESRNGKLVNVKTLLEKGIDINAQDFAGWTALHEAILAHQNDVVKLLLDQGALIDIPGLNYTTTLHNAIQEKNISLVKLLVKYGANLLSYNMDGKTPLDLCYDDEMRSALCLTKRHPQITKRYTLPSTKVYFTDTSNKCIGKISACPDVKVITKINLLYAGGVSYVVVGTDKPNIMLLQAAMLQGACIVTKEWAEEYVSQQYVQNPLNYLAKIPGFAIEKATMNKFNKLPKLFDSLQFYFCHNNRQKIGGYEYTIQNFKTLIEAGGGKVITRMPTRLLEQDECYPYHSPKFSYSATTTCYLIYDERKENTIKKQNLREMKHKSARWLIECVNNFTIFM